MRLIALTFLMATLGAAQTPAPASPEPVPTPAPAVVPGEIRHPASPGPPPGAASSAPKLPRYVRLGPLEQAQVDRLADELLEAEKLLGAHRLASLAVLLERARREADAADRKLLVLRLYPEWTAPRGRLDELSQRLQAAWREGPDPESRALVEAAGRRLEARLARLEHTAAKLKPAEVDRELRALHQELEQEGAQPLLAGNPAWREPMLAFSRRLEHLERFEALRIGQTALVEEILHMIELYAGARQKLAKADYDGALADYAALEEACVGFKADLKSLEDLGYDPRDLHVEGMTGTRDGHTFMALVDHWQLDARQRDTLVAEARDPWRKALSGDRLRIYGMYGVPTWPGAPSDVDAASALAQDLWVFYESPPGKPHERLRHEYHFVGDHLQHHELFRERLP